MTKRIPHVILIPFSGVGLFDDPDDEEWLEYRFSIFWKYTLASIINQSRKVDLLWLAFDGRENSEWVEKLDTILSHYEIPHVFTHYGLPYKDDKFTPSGIKYLPRMLGRAIKRRKPILFARYIHRLLFKNRSLAKRVKIPFNEDVYLTRMDSDDCLHKDYLKEIDEQEFDYRNAYIRNKGYVYNTNTQELAEWNPTTCPQFMTVCILQDTIALNRWEEYWRDYYSHEDAPKAFWTKTLTDKKYLMLMHEQQISSTWDHPFRGKSIEDKSILKDFGI